MDQQQLENLIDQKFLRLSQAELDSIINPLIPKDKQSIEEPHKFLLRLMRNPDYFYFTCKYLFDIELLPFQQVFLKELWYRPFPMLIASRGAGKSFILGLYSLLRGLFIQGRKIVITGSGFRQAKTIFNYAETIWHHSPILRNLVAENADSGPHHDADRWVLRLGDSTVTALPLGDGQKIRGERAHDIIADEFASIPRETFETVVAGFGVVNISPVEKVRQRARIDVMKETGNWTREMDEEHRLTNLTNQTIISGTAYYQFNHFAEYWKRWKMIIESKGDKRLLADAFNGEVPDNLDWRDYSIMRVPVEMLPPGFMDEKQVARSKATVHSGIYLNEFGACFSSDTNGFFKRSLVEGCVTNEPIVLNGETIQFRAMKQGNPHERYIFGIDPASEDDRFSIVVLEVHETHRRIVYCWTTTRQEHKARLENHLTKEKDFYGYCARKIRELMKLFPCEHIALDSQGGGIAVMEALHDPDKMEQEDVAIWPITSDHPLFDQMSKKDQDSDRMPGLHILEMVNFAKAEYVAQANHGMRKDFEDKVLLFPMYDPVILAHAMEDDAANKRIFDTLEDCVQEIEELKDELATIIHTQTPNTNRDRWDTPEVKLPGSKKGRLRKDRYSGLLIANAAARRLQRQMELPSAPAFGGFLNHFKVEEVGGPLYVQAPEWYTKGIDVNIDYMGLVG